MKSNGNALFLILIAVALFAALSYAVTQSGRGGSGIDKEQAVISAAEILQYASSIETAITRLRIINGCRIQDLEFADTEWTTTFGNSGNNLNAPSDGSCHIFDQNGGGLSFQNYFSQFIFADVSFTGLGNQCTNSNCTELYYLIRLSDPGAVNQNNTPSQALEICNQINKNLNDIDEPPISGDITQNPWNGDFGYNRELSLPELSGLQNACVAEATNVYSYYHILAVQ